MIHEKRYILLLCWADGISIELMDVLDVLDVLDG